MAWKKVGPTAAGSIATFANRLAALTPNKKHVYTLDPRTEAWTKIGGPAAELIGGGWDLYALSPNKQELWRYDGKDWTEVGGPGAQFVAICGSVYALTPDCTKVVRHDPLAGGWGKIGGPASALVGGGSKLYAIAPDGDSIWEYSRYEASWRKIGGPGAMFAGVGGTVYGLTPDKKAVYRYTGKPTQWTKVGGPAAQIIGGGSSLLAIQPGTNDLWRYSGKGEAWDKLGAPGAGFVSAGGTVWGMTNDKSAVWQYTEDNAETTRLRHLLYDAYSSSQFGRRVTYGFLVKELNGSILAGHFADVCFQPISTLKLLAYLHAVRQNDNGSTTLGAKVSWVQPTTGMPAQIADTTCLKSSDPNTKSGSAKLEDALPTMMWESHNRTLDAVHAKFGPGKITAQSQEIGLRQTEMYPGCPTGGHPSPWANNVSTLFDFARMFEGVADKSFVGKTSSQKVFWDNMIRLEAAPGTSYTSPITGRTTGPWSNEFLRPLVEREAGTAKAGIVSEFMTHVVLRGKGGSGGPSGTDVGGSDFLEVTVPFKKNGKVTLKKFLVGWYVCARRWPSQTVEDAATAKLDAFRFEIHAEPIRRGLKTW